MKDMMIWGFIIASGAFFFGILFYGFYIVLFPSKEADEADEPMARLKK